MTYEKQTWNKYDDLKTEEENIQNGAVVTDNRMNHMEEGLSAIDLEIASHESNKTNPHSVTKEQVGLSNVSNYGIATEAEAIAGTSNAKYMTPSLTKKAAKSYVDKTDVGLSNVGNVKQASKTEFDDHTANKNNPHGVTAAQIGAYTKSETDAKFKLTINDSGVVAAGTDLNSLNISGFYAISNKKPDTEILNYPKGIKLSGSGSIYAQVVVFKNASSTMIKQVFYDQLSTREYYRSFANNAWQEWQLAAIDSEVVHLKGEETIEGDKNFTGELKTSGNPVYGVTMNSGWYEEQLGDNFYRWTQVFTVTTAINQGAGSALQQSDTLTIPTPPTNISITSRFVQAGQAPWACWAMYFPSANAFRLFSYATRASGEATIEAVLYGSKS